MKKFKLLTLILIPLVFFLLCFLGYHHVILPRANRAQMHSTMTALAAALEAERDAPEIHSLLDLNGQNSRFLTQEEYDRVVKFLSSRHELDGPKDWKISGQLTDPWKRPFRIKIFKLQQGQGSIAFDVSPQE